MMIRPIKRSAIGRRTVLGAAGGIVLAAPAIRAQAQPTGVALVIGNSKYQWEAPLPNVKRDAPDIAKRLQQLGLKTELVQDATKDAMFSAIDKFKTTASGARFAALYFAGHGATWDKDTYLVPVDSDLSSPQTAQSLLPVKAISAAMQGAQHRLLVFDNCRNNPADGWRQRAASSSAFVSAADLAAASLRSPNTLLMYSTAPGRVAVDGPAGENSPFAASLLRQLSEASNDITTLPERVRRDLLVATQGRQVVWDENSYTQSYTISGVRDSSTRAPAPAMDPQRLVEMTNVYASARDKKLILPRGLVAFRPPSGSPHYEKVGAFASEMKTQLGNVVSSLVTEPVLMVVLRIGDNGVAQVIVACRVLLTDRVGPIWQFVTGQLFPPSELRLNKNPVHHLSWRWKDSDSGTCLSLNAGPPSQAKFIRLDG